MTTADPITIGIDPGLTGAIAALRDGDVVLLEDMPTVAKAAGKGRQVDAAGLAAILRPLAVPGAHAYVENVHAMPKQGTTSTFSFGVSLGVVLGCVAAIEIPYTLVSPGAWKRKAGLLGKDKDAARSRALQLHPQLADQLSRKCHHGRADALLVARMGGR